MHVVKAKIAAIASTHKQAVALIRAINTCSIWLIEPTDTTELGWRSTYVASVTPNTGGDDIEKPSYDIHDIFMSYSPKQIEGIKATVGVYNIFDENYANHASRIVAPRPDDGTLRTDFEPGRNIKASLTYQF